MFEAQALPYKYPSCLWVGRLLAYHFEGKKPKKQQLSSSFKKRRDFFYLKEVIFDQSHCPLSLSCRELKIETLILSEIIKTPALGLLSPASQASHRLQGLLCLPPSFGYPDGSYRQSLIEPSPSSKGLSCRCHQRRTRFTLHSYTKEPGAKI